MSNISLLVLTREYPVGYAGTKRVQHLIEYLKKDGIAVTVISYRSKRRIEQEIGIYNSIPYIRIGSGIVPKPRNIARMIYAYFQLLILICRTKARNKKNILYCYGGIDIENFIAIFFSKILGYKIIFDLVEDFAGFSDHVKLSSKIKFWSVKKLDLFNVRVSNAIVVISAYLFKKYELLNAKHLTLIPITANTQDKILLRYSFNTPFTIAYAGSFGDKDGVELIIQGFLQFNKKVPGSKLILIGAGDQKEYYNNKYSNDESIRFTGFIPDAEYYSLIREADVLCMCRTGSSYANAGFPFKLGEYLATGNPVIATNVSNVNLYLDERSVFLIEPDNTQQYIDALVYIYNHPAEAFKIGYNGYIKCKEHFSPELNSKILIRLIEKL